MGKTGTHMAAKFSFPLGVRGMKVKRSSGSVWPACIALALTIASGYALWKLVARDVQPKWSAGIFVTGDFRFVYFFSGLLGIVAFLAARRILEGPRLRLDEWTLSFPKIEPEPRGYRHVDEVRVGELAERLAHLGYAVETTLVGNSDEPSPVASAAQPLAAAHLCIKDTRCRVRGAGVTLRLSHPQPEQNQGFGFVEVADVRNGLYTEMAQFLISALGELIPGLEFKRTASAVSANPAAVLKSQLPPAPEHLPR